jgi:hypothetical protein
MVAKLKSKRMILKCLFSFLSDFFGRIELQSLLNGKNARKMYCNYLQNAEFHTDNKTVIVVAKK